MMTARSAPFIAKDIKNMPSLIIIQPQDCGYLAQLDSHIFFYQDGEECSRQIFPCIRFELIPTAACAGTC